MNIRFQNYAIKREENRNQEKHEKFQKWLNSNTDRNISNANKIETISYAIFNSLKNSNYKINNEKEFKDELATYIYHISQIECPREI